MNYLSAAAKKKTENNRGTRAAPGTVRDSDSNCYQSHDRGCPICAQMHIFNAIEKLTIFLRHHSSIITSLATTTHTLTYKHKRRMTDCAAVHRDSVAKWSNETIATKSSNVYFRLVKAFVVLYVLFIFDRSGTSPICCAIDC